MATYDRMDAGFFLALREIEADLPALRERYTAAEALALLCSLGTSMKEAVLPLARGSRANKQRAIESACAEYPHMALALVRKGARDLLQDLQAKQAEDAGLISKLEQLAQ
jgi:hypothetical protein